MITILICYFVFQETEKEEGWARNYVKDKNLLIAQLGPTGGKKGYGTITGKYGNLARQVLKEKAKPSGKLRRHTPSFGCILAVRPKKIFFRNKTFLFFKIES